MEVRMVGMVLPRRASESLETSLAHAPIILNKPIRISPRIIIVNTFAIVSRYNE